MALFFLSEEHKQAFEKTKIAIEECNDLEFLPQEYRKKIN